MNTEPIQQSFWDMKALPKERGAFIVNDPLSSPLWAQIETGLFEAMTCPSCNVTMSELRELIKAERFGVLVVTGGNMLFGVALLDPDDGWLDMSFVWSEGLETLNELMDGAESIAKATGMRGIKMVTAEDRVQSYAKRRGFKIRLVEYLKEV